jgi:hypothetical protein
MSINQAPATSYTPPPPAAQPAKKSGCMKWALIGCGSLLVLGAIFCVIIVVVVFGAMKKSDVYQEALKRAQNDPAVIAALGTPIEAGLMVTGSVNVDSSGGHATLDFPISGPKGKATVHAVGTKSGGEKWDYTELTVTPANGSKINLLPPPSTTTTTTETSTTTTDTSATSTDTSATSTDTTATTSTTDTSSTSTQ